MFALDINLILKPYVKHIWKNGPNPRLWAKNPLIGGFNPSGTSTWGLPTYQNMQTCSLQGQVQSTQILACFMCLWSFILDLLWISYAQETGSEWAQAGVGS